MTFRSTIEGLKRPRVLLRAAQINGQFYTREKTLKGILKRSKLPNSEVVLETLIEREDVINSARLSGDASYSIQRHIAILSALLMELRLNTA